MKEIGFEELKELQLEILYKIDCFCKKNSIKYFLTAGSLIGAVRHAGYIPWDDDIDIMLLRPDYDRLIHEFNGQVKDLKLMAPELNWEYYAPYANIFDTRTILEEDFVSHRFEVVGVKIDVFPFDALPKNENKYTIERNFIYFLNKILSIKRSTLPFKKRTVKKRIATIFASLLPYSFLQRIIRLIATSTSYDTVDDVFLRTFDINKPMRAPKSIFDQVIYTKFEKYFFPIPGKYDDYLKIRFGNYMQLPPMEQRVPHHGFKAYWK